MTDVVLMMLTIPLRRAGYMKRRESPEVAIRREVREEVGTTLDREQTAKA
jgi:hypothetical protein